MAASGDDTLLRNVQHRHGPEGYDLQLHYDRVHFSETIPSLGANKNRV